MELTLKIFVALAVFALMYIIIRRLSFVFTNRRGIKQDEDILQQIDIQLADESLSDEDREILLQSKKAYQHDINVRKGDVQLKSKWRPE
ncbi:hypothetical protein EJN23_21485 [Salmonella enterica]|nr:hypothetical protein [Salmonella enterica]